MKKKKPVAKRLKHEVTKHLLQQTALTQSLTTCHNEKTKICENVFICISLSVARKQICRGYKKENGSGPNDVVSEVPLTVSATNLDPGSITVCPLTTEHLLAESTGRTEPHHVTQSVTSIINGANFRN